MNAYLRRRAMLAAGLTLLTATAAALRAQESTATTNGGVYSEAQA